jgi:hypothetical protein
MENIVDIEVVVTNIYINPGLNFETTKLST